MKQVLPISKLVRNSGQIPGLPKNPRIIRDAKFEKLVKSVKEDPELLEHRGILVFPFQDKYVAIGGNMRLEACRTAGITDITCEILDPATPAEKLKAFMIKDNASFGEWDWDIMAAEFDMDWLADCGIDIPNIDLEDPEELEAEEDDYEAPESIEEVETQLQPGDLLEFKKGAIHHRLYCGSSTVQEDVQRLMNGRLADLCVMDPPYNVNYEGGTGLKIQNDNMSDGNFHQFLLDAFKLTVESLKPGAAYYIWHADSEGYNFRSACKHAGLRVRQCLIWVKNSLVMGRQDYQWKHEPCLYGWKDGAGHFFVDERNHTTVYEDKIDFKKLSKPELVKLLEDMTGEKVSTTVIHEDKPSKNAEHPTMKPVRLIARAIKNSSKLAQVVVDFFGGSGTTMVASHQLGRSCYMMEFDPRYCQVIFERMVALDPELKVFINGEEIN